MEFWAILLGAFLAGLFGLVSQWIFILIKNWHIKRNMIKVLTKESEFNILNMQEFSSTLGNLIQAIDKNNGELYTRKKINGSYNVNFICTTFGFVSLVQTGKVYEKYKTEQIKELDLIYKDIQNYANIAVMIQDKVKQAIDTSCPLNLVNNWNQADTVKSLTDLHLSIENTVKQYRELITILK